MTPAPTPLDRLEVVDEGRRYILASYCGGGLFTAPFWRPKFRLEAWTHPLVLRELDRAPGGMVYVYATRKGAEKALARLRGAT